MNCKHLLFLTMARIKDFRDRSIYNDLLRKFQSEGFEVYIVTPMERSLGFSTNLKDIDGVHILGVRTLNLQKTNIIEKGLGQILIEYQFKNAIRKFFKGIQFDLVLYSTPPVTFPNVVSFIKKKNPHILSYLLLKDIFPQNAVDLGLMKKTGLSGFLYRFFLRKEKALYQLSDFIGCMSPANVDYLLAQNPEISDDKVEVAPNSIALKNADLEKGQFCSEKEGIRSKYHLPMDVPIFIYGGNLGKPQGIPFLIDCLDVNGSRKDCHFLIIGTGTELPRIKEWFISRKPKNVTVMDGLPKAEYDLLVRSCDVGLIFLDHRFTIPNFPSRLLSYLENKMPILCATDPICDMGKIAEKNGFGCWCESNSVEAFTVELDRMIHADRETMGEKGYAFLCDNYLVENTYNAIVKHV